MRHLFHPEAVAEAREARQWYAERDRGVAAAFVKELEVALGQILAAPDAWPPFEAGTRRYVLRRFPYHVIYRVANEDTIQIVAVMHGRRRPGYWRKR